MKREFTELDAYMWFLIGMATFGMVVLLFGCRSDFGIPGMPDAYPVEPPPTRLVRGVEPVPEITIVCYVADPIDPGNEPHVRITFASAALGDLNEDGVIDLEDFAEFSRQFMGP